MSATATTPSFSDFLASSGTQIHPHVVIGNEAGDADSIVSALAKAYVDSPLQQETPVVSIPRADLCLRRETIVLLDLANIDTDKLCYIIDERLLKAPRQVTLVDHNRLAVDVEDWTVTEILDHHHDEAFHSQVEGEFRNIAFENGKALVASTCTLIAERLFASTPQYWKVPHEADFSIALLGVILLDTVNMSPHAGKGTPRDQAAIDTLVKNTDWSTLKDGSLLNSQGTIDTQKLYDKLSQSKFDSDFWNELSMYDALRLDYKRFNDSFGASSILLEMDSFLAKPNFVQGMNTFMAEYDIPLLAVLSMRLVEHVARRELLLCSSDQRIVDDMVKHLVAAPELELEEKKIPLDTKPLYIRQFRQGNSKASRKQVAPIMLNFYTSSL